MSSDLRHQKEALRTRFREERGRLSEEAHRQRSSAITRRIKALPELEDAHTVHCYWPVVERREADTRPLIDWLHASGWRVVLPVIASYEGRPEMEHRRYTGRAALTRNRWGLYEPIGTDAVPAEALDLVVVPAFGAGRNGHRIGHGFGYYDAFLQDLDVVTVCPVYEACLVDAVPAEPHDVPLSVLVTEDEVYRPGT